MKPKEKAAYLSANKTNAKKTLLNNLSHLSGWAMMINFSNMILFISTN